ncbi:MAG: hypothetical protein L0154_23200 [Chloroflexi bacterium]|nr:hypothetical protein [Chloroflexota bacterium]
MRRISVLFLMSIILVIAAPVLGQGDDEFRWPIPINSGEMPLNQPLLPPSSVMPALPLPETLKPGTIFINAEAFGEEYIVENLTFDERLYAYNISTERGALPVSPNGQYGIITLSDNFQGPVTCSIIDLLTGTQVDEFLTDGACSGVEWSPDNTRLLLTITDDNGVQSLGIRQNGETTTLRPVPTAESDLGGGAFGDSAIYIINGWVSNNVISVDMGLDGALTETLFVDLANTNEAIPAVSMTPEQSDKSVIIWRPAQALSQIDRGLWITNLATGDSFQLAPDGHTAIFGDVSPDGTEVAYWAAVATDTGPAHPLRLVVYNPTTDSNEVLLQFEGPADQLVTRPGLVVFNDEGVYFHIGQLDGAPSPMVTGTYRISRDGLTLEYVSEFLMMDSLPDAEFEQ